MAGGVEPDMDMAALEAYLTLDYVPAPLSIYKGIQKLPAAHRLICTKRGITMERYWQPKLLAHRSNGRQAKQGAYAEELVALIREAVQIRLVSDVPVGVLLSGGVDSSTVVAMMAQVTDQPIRTFSIGSPDAAFNELPYARVVAERYDTQHHEFVVEPDALAVLPELMHVYDEPFADSSAIPTYYVSRLAHEHVKVVLSGDGGDELFAGYPWYWLLRRDDWMTRLPGPFRRTIFGQLYRAWPAGWRGKRRMDLWRQNDAASRYAVTRNRFPHHERQLLLTAELRAMFAQLPACDTVARAASDAQKLDRVSMMQYADLMTYLPEDLLVKVDRASMSQSLEVRAPLLDHKLVGVRDDDPNGAQALQWRLQAHFEARHGGFDTKRGVVPAQDGVRHSPEPVVQRQALWLCPGRPARPSGATARLFPAGVCHGPLGASSVWPIRSHGHHPSDLEPSLP